MTKIYNAIYKNRKDEETSFKVIIDENQLEPYPNATHKFMTVYREFNIERAKYGAIFDRLEFVQDLPNGMFLENWTDYMPMG